jgi:hypothetical protein
LQIIFAGNVNRIIGEEQILMRLPCPPSPLRKQNFDKFFILKSLLSIALVQYICPVLAALVKNNIGIQQLYFLILK